MTLSFEAPKTEVEGRAASLARRLVGGAGAASLDAYRVGECLEFVAHGIAEDGSLVVAAMPAGTLAAAADGVPIDVRLDVVKQAPDPAVSIVSASAHLLGELAWVPASEAVRAGLPASVEAMADVPGVRFGVVAVRRAVLHDLTGATVIDEDQLYYEAPSDIDAYAAFEKVAGLDQGMLKDLCWAVMVDATPGLVISKPAMPSVCQHMADRVFCVDVDDRGLTMMLVGTEETLLVYAAFARPVASLSDLDERLFDLMGAAVLAA
ncbi:hypothetical protein [Tessaracoccus palaemonis]|uniref:DUF2470 domain-containing protein n=1 Tax=Tessaracoccus palaemonis TaxID=2829499 RepID=A0ABX8SML0_9ACTN|nr:hypothetical protein [Tessaracoccus palaemonis]QXT63615.1 hypothetical protein KDB89_03820 [Tessaracoccus palaemonis]